MSNHSYSANCHCGQVKLIFTLAEPIQESEIIRCNCSICTKSGYINVYPLRKDVTFCPRCGTSMLIDFRDSPYESERPHYAININTIASIQDIMSSLKILPFDGHNKLKPSYEVPQ
ncbi:glutathione-dependent formaldehyde-activating protein [Venturia nashicola]|uniref:Glutathione-dependent formaldehyde-activating protein n=1 Tax=Venturia nashicola TaxID=86259 RepID=A0A4Z1NX19_9PEZI|nr:glutathione-dependent formaldehyde-activating protein [Venturia nashicola]TLD23501.1 glutathione-dependent formaldehyde-activating protein [Venturia nashicola]